MLTPCPQSSNDARAAAASLPQDTSRTTIRRHREQMRIWRRPGPSTLADIQSRRCSVYQSPPSRPADQLPDRTRISGKLIRRNTYRVDCSCPDGTRRVAEPIKASQFATHAHFFGAHAPTCTCKSCRPDGAVTLSLCSPVMKTSKFFAVVVAFNSAPRLLSTRSTPSF